ncbi:beta-1,4-N-acetylgalactosaminyltransferase 3-like [Actinia tenebrosa]|uniref:Hexosyltransferase n=1 Tax=Actinia tenebrosa TaxID=6105 RepID=A0A6P8IQJ9_ACTTE|nr:beta-1,4-N-acetylgalactosaminyltransferase 3-like [Actinia tenebrosa]
MFRIVVNRCRRKTTVLFLLLAGILILVRNIAQRKRREEEIPTIAVLISQRGHPHIPHYISSKHLYNYTETLRIQTLRKTGVFASVNSGRAEQINIHLWFNLCGSDLRTLLYFPCFPNVPSARKLYPSLEIKNLGESYGKRVFGFIVAPESTGVLFRLKASGTAEFWLSSDKNPQNCRRILQIASPQGTDFLISDEFIELKRSNFYYFEILHKHGGSREKDFISLEWKFGEKNNFQQISAKYFHGYQDDLHIAGDVVNPKSFPLAGLKIHRKNISERAKVANEIYHREDIYQLPFFPQQLIKDLFPKCPYKPKYLIKRKLERYGSKWENIYSSLYPSDNSNVTESNGFVTFGNDVLGESEALKVVDMVKKQFVDKGLRDYELQNIINIESKHYRYLVELQFRNIKTEKSFQFSEYLYLPERSSSLCYPEGFSWNKTSMVNFLVTSGHNQARWVYHFINNMDKIYKETKDVNFNIIINDFLSPHADLKQALESSSLPNYMLLTTSGRFHKTLGLQQAANAVTDPLGIVVILDLHLDVPAYFVDDVRKHTVLGLQAYSPVLARLECGSNAVVKMGSYWEFHGYGMVGIYKKDWDKFGGMNIEEFKYKWGGEDIEMYDRILMAGYEADRKKIVGLHHYFHSKKALLVTSQ